ncbi:hypothetical protein [Tolypothrix sp. VBCCA 56010]
MKIVISGKFLLTINGNYHYVTKLYSVSLLGDVCRDIPIGDRTPP